MELNQYEELIKRAQETLKFWGKDGLTAEELVIINQIPCEGMSPFAILDEIWKTRLEKFIRDVMVAFPDLLASDLEDFKRHCRELFSAGVSVKDAISGWRLKVADRERALAVKRKEGGGGHVMTQ